MTKQPDFATGKPVDLSKPEESVRQDYEQQLVIGYGYPKDYLDIEVRIPRGSSHFPEAADLVIYRSASGRSPTSDIHGIVEFKRPGRQDGVDQLKSYMTATSALWGVWTNGTDIRYICRDPQDHTRLLEGYLHNAPAFGQSIGDVGKLSKSDLVPFARAELKIILGRILNKLYANAQLARRDQLGAEMVKLLFAKIEDETTFPDKPPDFRVQAGETPTKVAGRISALFSRVVQTYKADEIFEEHDSINLDAQSIAEVVGQLERGSLTLTDTDVVGDAFEVFAESRLAGERGQFFTPRGVVRLAVRLVDPQPDQYVCDPACGSGGFLIQAMRHVWALMDSDQHGQWGTGNHLEERKRHMAASTIYGVDKEIDLVKIAKAYMAIAGDGRSNVRRGDSIGQIEENEGKFDIILTNPPFGTRAKVQTNISRNFQLGHRWKETAQGWVKLSQARACDPYVLFIERCLDMAKDDGKVVMVLPETVFHAPTLGYVRQHIRSRSSVDAIVDLPHNSLRPHCNAKTCLLVLSKNSTQQSVIMATPSEMGHDLQGKTLFRPGTEEIWDDLLVVESELANPSDEGNRFTFVVDPEAINNDECWVPKYHRGLKFPPKLPKGCAGITLEQLIKDGIINVFSGHGSPHASEKGRGSIPYIRVADIVNWEAYHNPVSRVPNAERLRLKADQRPPEIDDILFVRRGSYRIGTVAIIGPRDTNAILTSELLTIRVNDNDAGITPPYLLAMLSTDTVQSQIPPKICVDTTLPNLGDRWKSIIVPLHQDMACRDRLGRSAEQIIAARRSAWNETDQLARQLGDLTT